MWTYFALLPIVVGVGAASMGDMTFTVVGFLVVQASNVGFSARAVFTKQLKRLNADNQSKGMGDIELFLNVSRLGLIIIVPAAAVLDFKSASAALKDPLFSPLYMCTVMFLNGLAYTAYNLASFAVLSRVDTSSHAVLNVFRRVFVITVTTVYFGTPMSAANMFGIMLAVAGVLAFTVSKQSSARASKQAISKKQK